MLRADHISFEYNNQQRVLDDVTFLIERGTVLGLLGHNGSGKSTLLKIISGLEKPLKGELTLNDQPVEDLSDAMLYKTMGILIEEPSMYPHLSIADNLKIILNYRGISEEQMESSLKQVGMWENRRKKVRSLSTGMKQRVGISRVLLSDPDLLILDEPTNGLDPDGMVEIRNLILEQKSRSKTMIISSHLLSEMERICDQFLILRNGKEVFFGTKDALGEHRDLESFYLSFS